MAAKSTLDQLKERFPEIKWIPVPTPRDHPNWVDSPFEPNARTVLPVGHRKDPKYRAFTVPTVYERDVSVTMRDGAVLYTDIFRPEGDAKVPAILPWSPYGKTGSPFQYDLMAPYNCGVSLESISGYQKWEAPDPAEWIARGYAVVNIDSRGANNSDGDVVFWGPQEAEDIYDTITWISEQPWCNGSVVMAGNSWLAVCQLNFASRFTHPNLKAIAPWEGLSDCYNDMYMRGGKPHQQLFTAAIQASFSGKGCVEDINGARITHPLFDEYWETKRAAVENINTPLYQGASYSSGIHLRGSIDAFEKAKTDKKWLRIHPYFEWYDLYRPEMVDDLQRFFDFYAKGIDNGWERETPRVRLSLLGCDGSDEPTVVERPHETYPVESKNLVVHLDAATGTMSLEAPMAEATASYEGASTTGTADFTFTFDRRTEISGYAKVKLWMSCDAHDDMDIGVQLRKVGRDGKLMSQLNYPVPIPPSELKEQCNITTWVGCQGFLRASHAVSRDDAKSHGNVVVYAHDKAEPVPKGTIVPLEITFWPVGIVFGPGEGIMLRVSGHDMNLPEFATLPPDPSANVGTHVITTGGQCDSYLTLPVISE